jgi:CubicO group peptidase (beta-lactamase class C family)
VLRAIVSLLLLLGISLILAQAQTLDWVKAPSSDSGISATKLQALESAVRSGEFKKIGSVLIARHGQLVYESYFDGDANTLRDTRSATKSITGALIGIAIAQNKLSGVDARVLDLLPDRARTLQNRRFSDHEFAARVR